MTTKVRVSLEEFLAMPEEKPYRELMDGEVVQKSMPNAIHAGLVLQLGYLLKQFQREHPAFLVATELRHADMDTDWVYLPDVSVLLKSPKVTSLRELPNPVDVAPDFAIEVLSPDDRPGVLSYRIAAYARAGTTLLWLVDPETRGITVFQRGAEPVIADPARPLSAAPVLPGFELDIPALFAILDD